MAVAGLILLVRTIRHPRPVSPPQTPPDKAASWLQVAVFTFLVIYPLGIPTSWTRANIIEKRQEAIEDTRLLTPVASVYQG
jgi:phosphatidylglycerol:prolipoprotein diacylglycerol transferase